MQLHFLQEWFSGEIVKALGWTLIHSLWQGLVAALAAGIVVISTRRTSALLRYNLLGSIFLLFVAGAIITFTVQLKSSTSAGVTIPVQHVSIAGNSVIAENTTHNGVSADTMLERFTGFVNANAGFVVLTWCIVFLLHCLKLFTGLAGVQRIRNKRTHVPPAEWITKMDQLSSLLGIQQTVRLIQSEIVRVPVAIGYFKPVILLPLGLLSNLPADQVETILLHELAHIRRKDYLVNIIQRFAEAVFFFNPALLWISSLIRQEREACCDDLVVSNTTYKKSYLSALVSFQEYYAASGYAMAIKSKQNYLLNRVKRMITRENKKLNIMEKIFLLTGLVAVTAFTFIPAKDAPGKDNPAIVPVFNGPVATPPVKISSKVTHPLMHVHTGAGKKDEKILMLDAIVNAIPADTVPPSKKGKEKEVKDYSDLKFPDMSSTINDDGKTRTETTTVTDENGKKYTYTRINDKITSLTVDGRKIPEDEIDNYSGLIERIQDLREENRARRELTGQLRKLAMAKRAQDITVGAMNRDVERKYLSLQNLYLREQARKLKRQDKSSENERRAMLKLLQQLKQKRPMVPMLNGREIIRNEIQMNDLVSVRGLAAIDMKKKPALALTNLAPSKAILANSPEKDLLLNPQIDLSPASPLRVVPGDQLLQDDELQLNARPDLDREVIQVKPGSTLKSLPVKKLMKKQFLRPRRLMAEPSKRRVTT